MAKQVDQNTRPPMNRMVKIPTEIWASVSHEAIDRRTSMYGLVSIAWNYFMSLPESKRDKMVREFEEQTTAA